MNDGKAALWVCGALVGLLQAKGVVTDAEIVALAEDLEKTGEGGSGDRSPDIEQAAEWLRKSIQSVGG